MRILLTISLLFYCFGVFALDYYNTTTATDASLLASWTTDAGGGIGAQPPNFTGADVFHLRVGTSISNLSSWTVSGDLDINGSFTFANAVNINGDVSVGGGISTLTLSSGTASFGSLTVTNGTFNINTATGQDRTLSIVNNVSVSGGLFNIQAGTAAAGLTSIVVLNVGGNLSVTGGALDLNSGTNGGAVNAPLISIDDFKGQINLDGDFNFTGGEIRETGLLGTVSSELRFVNNATRNVDITSGNTFEAGGAFTDPSNSINFFLDDGFLVFSNATTIFDGSRGDFTMASFTGLNLKHVNGLHYDGGTPANSGCIRVLGTREYGMTYADGSRCDFTFSGIGQTSGNEFPTELRNFIVESAADVVLTSNLQHEGIGGDIQGDLDLNGRTFEIISGATVALNPGGDIDHTVASSILDVDGILNFNDGIFTDAAADGSEVTVGATGTVNVNGNGLLLPDATWNAASNCNLNGLIDASTAPTLDQNFGNINFNGGSAAAQIDITLPATYGAQGNMIMTNIDDRELTLSDDVLVGGNFDFVSTTASSLVFLNTNVFKIEGSLLNGGDQNFFVSGDDQGALSLSCGSSANVEYHIGFSSSGYRPTILNNSGTTDFFSVGMANVVYSNATIDGSGTGGSDFYGATPYRVVQRGVDITWYINEEVTGGSATNITLQWLVGDELTGFEFNNSQIQHYYDPAGGGNLEWNVAAGENRRVANVGGTYRSHTTEVRQTEFSPWGVASGSGPLPIELISFEVVKMEHDAVIDWATALEINHSHFDIEVAEDDETGKLAFRKLGRVYSNGESNVNRYYQFTDTESNKTGVRYYRLKSIDKDGSATYSVTKSVEFSLDAALFSVQATPNPTVDMLNLGLTAGMDGIANIEVSNLAGQMIFATQHAVVVGRNASQISLKQYPKGVYLVKVSFGGKVFNTKIVKE